MRIRNYIIALVFLSLFFVLGKTPSKAAVYQSCSPGVQCTLTCSVHDTYYFSAYNGSDPIVYASCTGHLDGTCTFSRENYKPNNYQISCGSASGGDTCTPKCAGSCNQSCATDERLEETDCTPRNTSCTPSDGCDDDTCSPIPYNCYPIGACQNCTPTTPANYHDPLPGENPIYNTSTCITSNTCDKVTTCGVTPCGTPPTVSKNFYLNEPNTKPSPPEELKIDVDGWISPVLSTSNTTPTLIKYPYSSSSTNTSIKEVTSAPAGSGAYGWELYIGSTLITPRKVFNTTPPFNVYGPFPSISWLTQGYNGAYRAQYYTRDYCDNDEIRSDSLMGYFKVNTLPVSMASITGSGGNNKGCAPTPKFTGKHMNKTLTITVSGTDVDDMASINGAILWFVKDGSNISSEIGARTYVGPADAFVDTNKFGLFINRGGTVYMTMNSGGTFIGWGRSNLAGGSTPHPVKDGDGSIIITDVQRVSDGFNLSTGRYEFVITLEFPEESPLTGHYTLYTGLTDTLSYVSVSAGMSLDQRNVTSSGSDWNFDFINPTITNVGTSIDDSRILTLNWNSHDVGSTIRSNHTIVNVYKDEDPQPVMRTVPPPNSEVTPGSRPLTSLIGDYAPLVSGWRFLSSGDNREMKISTGLNTGGNLYFYITAYDNACNMGQVDSSSVPQINLDKWVHTKGGIFYSKGTVNYATKPAVSPDYFNLGTELISSESNSINTINIINNPLNNRNPAVAKSITDINNNTGQYDSLKENFDRIEPNLKPATVNGSNITCSEPLGCKWNTTTIGDISYTGKIIAYSDTDITINGEIKNIGFGANQNKDGMIIFSGGSITINGSTLTGSSLHADTIAAWLLAKENVVLAAGSVVANDYQDQVIVDGGIIAFGESGTNLPAFQLSRTLGLYNITHPVLITNFHPKYSTISSLFFGLHIPAYKREVGFKSI